MNNNNNKENAKLKKIRYFNGTLEDFKTFWEEQIKKQRNIKKEN